MKRIKLLVLAALFLACSLGVTFGIIFYQVNNIPMFSYWNVVGYDPGDPITLYKGKDKEMYIAATAPAEITKFQVRATMVFSGFQITYPLPDVDERSLESPLPANIGDEIRCRLSFPIHPSFPIGDGILVLTFYGQDDIVIAAGAAKFTIVD